MRDTMERRKDHRWDGRLLVDIEDDSELVFEVVGLNLSLGGMCMIFPDAPPPKVGSLYRVSFRLPTLVVPLDNEVKVCWIDTIRTKLCGVSFIHGFRAREVYAWNELISLGRKS